MMPDPAAQGAEGQCGAHGCWRVKGHDGVCTTPEGLRSPPAAQGAEERRFPGQDQPGVWVLYRRERDAWWRVRWSDTPRLGANGLEVIEVVPLSRAQEAEMQREATDLLYVRVVDESKALRARLEAVEKERDRFKDVVLGTADQLDIQTGLVGRPAETKLAEYERRCQAAADKLRAALAPNPRRER